MSMKLPSATWRPFCLGLNVLAPKAARTGSESRQGLLRSSTHTHPLIDNGRPSYTLIHAFANMSHFSKHRGLTQRYFVFNVEMITTSLKFVPDDAICKSSFIQKMTAIRITIIIPPLHKRWNGDRLDSPWRLSIPASVRPSLRPFVEVFGTFWKSSIRFISGIYPYGVSLLTPYSFLCSYLQFLPSGGQIFTRKWGLWDNFKNYELN